jgi:beta-lactamase class A
MSLPRRTLLLAPALLSACAAAPTPIPDPAAATALADLERRAGGRLGVSAVDTGSGTVVDYRADERFLVCSTGKLLAAAMVRRTGVDLARRVRYPPTELVDHSPITEQHGELTVGELCRAALTVSDNTAMNLLLGLLGGPAAVTAFLRAEGDPVTRLDRTETALNVRDGDLDTSTPAQMAANLRRFALGDDTLTGWLRATTTGATRIRAGLPADWVVGDKTGAGAQGEVDDVAVAWPPGRAPVVVAVYAEPPTPDADAGPTVAEAARIVAGQMS